METTTPTAWTSGSDGEPIAAYETAHGAELAVERLTAEGFPSELVAIRPLVVRPLPGWRERTRRQEHSVMAALAALAVAAVSSVVAAATTSWGPPMIVLTFFVVAMAFTILGTATAAWWAARVRERARGDRRLVAQAFEVRCRADAARARRVLARWWNPAARPTIIDR